MKAKLLLSIVFMVLGCFTTQVLLAQGSTTAAMNGQVTDINGAAVPGATVLAVHTPTGSQFGNVSDAEGYYRIPNMNVGGPYTVTVSFVGFEDVTQNNIYLTLGQTFRFNAVMEETVCFPNSVFSFPKRMPICACTTSPFVSLVNKE